ncbi:MAG: oligosaccharide flippase family protein [bacterium]|nr:oligosaccharide flippase family protein [bacterium]
MGIKKNFVFSSFLSVSNFIFPLLTFPYVTRVLGVTNIGIFNWVNGITQYFVFISMMGIGIIGIREVAKNKSNPIELSKTFSSLLILNAATTIVALISLMIAVTFVPQLANHKEMFYIAAANIFFNLFLVEWFFKGIEDFKYITLRSLTIKIFYTLAIFIFVRHRDDYIIYYLITVVSVVINALFNWFYSRNFVRFSLKKISIKPYIKPYFTLGFYLLLNSLYSTFNIIYLGFVAGDKEVGYYSTAIKLFGVSMAFFTAFTGVMMPRISSLLAENNTVEVKRLIYKSFDILFVICFPIIIYCCFFAPQIIYIIAGPGFEGAILPMRITMPLLLIIGIEQILILQLLMPLKNDKAIFINSLIGAVVGLSLGVFLVKNYQSVGSSFVLVCEEIAILISASYFVKKSFGFSIPLVKVVNNILFALPYVVIDFLILKLDFSAIMMLIIAFFLSLIYFLVIEIVAKKNEMVLGVFYSLQDKFLKT